MRHLHLQAYRTRTASVPIFFVTSSGCHLPSPPWYPLSTLVVDAPSNSTSLSRQRWGVFAFAHARTVTVLPRKAASDSLMSAVEVKSMEDWREKRKQLGMGSGYAGHDL